MRRFCRAPTPPLGRSPLPHEDSGSADIAGEFWSARKRRMPHDTFFRHIPVFRGVVWCLSFDRNAPSRDGWSQRTRDSLTMGKIFPTPHTLMPTPLGTIRCRYQHILCHALPLGSKRRGQTAEDGRPRHFHIWWGFPPSTELFPCF